MKYDRATFLRGTTFFAACGLAPGIAAAAATDGLGPSGASLVADAAIAPALKPVFFRFDELQPARPFRPPANSDTDVRNEKAEMFDQGPVAVDLVLRNVKPTKKYIGARLADATLSVMLRQTTAIQPFREAFGWSQVLSFLDTSNNRLAHVQLTDTDTFRSIPLVDGAGTLAIGVQLVNSPHEPWLKGIFRTFGSLVSHVQSTVGVAQLALPALSLPGAAISGLDQVSGIVDRLNTSPQGSTNDLLSQTPVKICASTQVAEAADEISTLRLPNKTGQYIVLSSSDVAKFAAEVEQKHLTLKSGWVVPASTPTGKEYEEAGKHLDAVSYVTIETHVRQLATAPSAAPEASPTGG